MLQIVELLNRFGSFKNSPLNILKYGTEFEMFLMRKVKVNGKERYTVSIELEEIMRSLSTSGKNLEVLPEFAAFMIEIIPKNPF